MLDKRGKEGKVSKCDELALEAYGKVIEETIGKGGKTIFEVPPKVEKTEKKN